jgi:hypothetical protein
MIEVEIPVTNRVNLHFLGDKREKKKVHRWQIGAPMLTHTALHKKGHNGASNDMMERYFFELCKKCKCLPSTKERIYMLYFFFNYFYI